MICLSLNFSFRFIQQGNIRKWFPTNSGAQYFFQLVNQSSSLNILQSKNWFLELLLLRSLIIIFSKSFLELSSHSSIGSHIFTSFLFWVFIKYSNEKLKIPSSFNFQIIISSRSPSIWKVSLYQSLIPIFNCH